MEVCILKTFFLGLAGSLVDILRERIILGELSPSDKINEVKIAKDFGISRAPLREALRVLENEHLVVSVPRKGCFVTEVSIENLNDIYQVREMIECYAIDLLKEKKIRELPEVVNSAESAAKLRVPSRRDSARVRLTYIEGLAEYHINLVKAANNLVLFEFYQTIFSNINRYRFLNAFFRGIAEHRMEEHYQILDLIRGGKYGKAKSIIKAHIGYG
jgi:DNA-binding GntR family transcriptional regulator